MPLDAHPVLHHARLEKAANDAQQAFVANAPGQTGHQKDGPSGCRG